MDAEQPGKLLGAVAAALARDLDTLGVALGGVRRSHRLAHADLLRDVLLLGGLHGLVERDLDLLGLRFERIGAAAEALEAAGDDTARQAAAEDLFALWNLDWAELGVAIDSLAPFDDPEDPGNIEAAATRLVARARKSIRYTAQVEASRERVRRICAQHARGNATVMAMLEATAIAIDADIVRVEHSEDRFWHAAEVAERVLLDREVVDGDIVRTESVPAATEVIGLEENPLKLFETPWTARQHAHLFHEIRRGFETRPLEVRIRGLNGRTIGPRLTHRDQCRGVGFAGTVPDGQVLSFGTDGRVTLDGTDVTEFAYAWEGACFADAGAPSERDTRFDEAPFALATPFDALDPNFGFPHAGESLPPLEIEVGVNRFGFYVQEAHHSSDPPDEPLRRVAPRPYVGFFDGSGFANEGSTFLIDGDASPDDARADVQLSWFGHEAYAMRVWVPERFQHFEPAEGSSWSARLARFLGRFKAAGIDLRVAFISDEWVLGEGVIGSSDSLLARIRPGTTLNPIPDDGD